VVTLLICFSISCQVLDLVKSSIPTTTPGEDFDPVGDLVDSIIATTAPIESAESAENLVFSDNFGNNQNNWVLGEYSGDYADANYQIVDGVYKWTVTSIQVANVTSWPTMNNVSDFTATVTARQTGDNPDDTDYGLIYVVPEDNHFLSFTLSNQDFSVYVFDEENSWVEIAPWTHSDAILAGEFNEISVTRSGDLFTFKVNGQELTTITYADIPEGILGLNVDIFPIDVTGTFEFDDFEVTNP
jgi:hypothetical protein